MCAKKLEKKTYEELTANSVVTIPSCQIRPVNGRILCISVDAGEQKTEGGIIIPTNFNSDPNKEKSKVQLRRYFVAAAEEGTDNYEGNKITRGDEVFPFMNQESISFQFPFVTDFYTGNKFDVIHYTELSALGQHADIIENKED